MSRPKLGQLLLSANQCTRDALMQAWEQKVLFGDRLGTNLLAGGHVDEKTLALMLGQQHGTRAAYGDVIQPDPRAIRGLSRVIARRHSIVPHHRDTNGVYLLMKDPDDEAAKADAGAALGSTIIPVVVCEARMWTLLNAHYGVEMGLRPIDLDGAAAHLKRIELQREQQAAPAPAHDLVSEAEFHALYQRVEEAAREEDAMAAQSDAADDVRGLQSDPSTNLGPGFGLSFDDSETDVLDLTPSMETDVALEVEYDSIMTTSDGMAGRDTPSLADSHDELPVVELRDIAEVDVVDAKTLSEPILFEAVEAAEDARKSAQQLGEELAAPDVPSAPSTTTAVDLEGVVRNWLPFPMAADVDTVDAHDPLDAVASAEAPADLFAPDEDDTPLSFDEATAALQHVRGRSEIARIVIRYALTRYRRAALLTVHPGNLLGWEGMGEGLSTARLSTFRLARSEDSVFALVAKTKAHYMGPLQRWPGNGHWVKHSGRQIPKTVAVFPILVRGEVVNLFYGDNGHQENVAGDVGELLILMQKISSSYESLLGRTQR